MSTLNGINNILGIKDSYKAPDRIMEILYGDIEERNEIFNQFLELFNYDVSFDWLHEYFQEEHAERKSRKQDFTPQSVAKTISAMVDIKDHANIYEPAAGTGGIIITNWNEGRMSTNPFTYRPSNYLYMAEELGDRTMPFLLLNLLVRGMNAIVIHGDTLERTAYGAFFIQNDNDDHLKFSSLNLLGYSENTEKMLKVKFVEEKYEPITQSEGMPLRLSNPEIFKEQLKSDEDLYNVLSLMHTGALFKNNADEDKREVNDKLESQEENNGKHQEEQLTLETFM